jgi:hypothetical protein
MLQIKFIMYDQHHEFIMYGQHHEFIMYGQHHEFNMYGQHHEFIMYGQHHELTWSQELQQGVSRLGKFLGNSTRFVA